jgi:hypothetical protein
MNYPAAPKWWLDTKRGVGTLVLAVGQLVPLVGVWTGVSVDPAVVGDLAANLATWFEVTWNVVGGGLLLWGAWRPTSGPITLFDPNK